MIEAYDPRAHPDESLAAQCNDFNSLTEMARGTDTILQGVRNAAPELVELPAKPVRRSMSRFGLVTLANRADAPALPLLRELLESRMIGWDFSRLFVIHQAQAFFVTSAKSNTNFKRRYSHPVG